jgi:hypothetical protein
MFKTLYQRFGASCIASELWYLYFLYKYFNLQFKLPNIEMVFSVYRIMRFSSKGNSTKYCQWSFLKWILERSIMNCFSLIETLLESNLLNFQERNNIHSTAINGRYDL